MLLKHQNKKPSAPTVVQREWKQYLWVHSLFVTIWEELKKKE